MAVTQPGDVVTLAPIAVQNDANYTVRGESVLGGYVALPSGSGPPTTTNIPLVMRRIGMLAYTPADGKTWQLIGGTADINWVRWFAVGAGAAIRAAWYVNQSTGNDANDGSIGAPLASLTELDNRLCPGGVLLQVAQSTVVHVAAGTYPELTIGISIPVGSGFTFDVACEFTSGSPITLSSVTDTVLSATPTRGNIQTASGAFADKARIRSTSGANAGAITYCTGLNGGATNAWVKQWFSESAFSVVNIASGTTCVVDTRQVTIDRVQIRCSGHPLGGQIRIFDAILPNGAELVNTIGGSASLFLSQCEVGAPGAICRVAGNVQFRNCRLVKSTQFSFYGAIPLLVGCEVEADISIDGVLQVSNGCAFNGATIAVSFASDQVPAGSGVYLSAAEWVNGAGVAIHVAPSCCVQVDGQQSGFGTPYAVGFELTGGALAVTRSASYLGILATQQITMAGVNANYSDVPLTYPSCSFVLLSDSSAKRLLPSASSADSAQTQLAFQPGGTAANNVFTSWSALVAFAAGVADPKVIVFDDTFATCVIPVGAWDLGRGCEFRGVLPASTTSSASSLRVDVTCADGVTFAQPLYAVRDVRLLYSGTHSLMTVPGTGKRFTFYLFGNGVVATTGAAGVAFSVPTSGSFGVQFRDQSFVTVSGGSFFWSVAAGASVAVITATGDGFNPPTSGARLPSNSLSGAAGPAYQFVQDFSGMISPTQASMPGGAIAVGTEASLANIPYAPADVTGWIVTPSNSQQGLDGLKALIAAGVFSVFGRVGAVAAVAGDYPASKITNDSSVSGAFVKDALNSLLALIGGGGGVTSVFGRAGAVVAALNDYTSSLIQNTSTVSGSTVTNALDALKAALPTAGAVSSVFGRTGAIAAALNDYTSSLIQNLSSVTSGGLTVTTALNALQSQATSIVSTVAGLVTGVSSVYGRAGAVVAATNDYNSTQVTNSSGVAGTGVTGALNTLDGEIAALSRQYASVVTTGLSSVTLGLTNVKGLFLTSGTAGSPTAFTVPNQSTVAWPIGCQIDFIALNADNFTITGAAGVTIRTPVGNLAATNSLYHLICIDVNLWELTRVPVDSSHLTNASGVSGSTVTDALNTLNAADGTINTLIGNHSFLNVLAYPIVPMISPAGWQFVAGGNFAWAGLATTGQFLGTVGPFAVGSTIDQFYVLIKPAVGGAHSGLPANMPRVRLWRTDDTTTTLTLQVTDPSASAAAYETPHFIGGAVPAPWGVTGSTSFSWELLDEGGTHSVAGLQIISVHVVLT